MPTLLFENGPDNGSGIELQADRTYLLGRDPRCDVVVRDDLVSRHHAKIKEFKGAWYIKDQGSTNGVLVNEKRVQQAELNFGDQVQLGSAILTFLEEGLDQVRKEKTLGGYRLRQRLGGGGMGTVYKALQVSLGREIALKVLAPHLVRDPKFVERFQKEARAAGQLNHPHIVQVYDVGEEGDTYFYSMEFISGGSLEDRLRDEGKLSAEETLAMLHQAAMALEYAESHHIVHRDIKPDNLMLTPDGTIKIADLGLAVTGKDHKSKDGPILGTPHFISPEQALRREVDIRSDIYSLGATAYRMLSGHTLFEGKSAEEIVKKAVREEPRPLRELVPEVPEKLAAVIHRMLEKDPDDRFASANDLREELEKLGRSRKRTVLTIGAVAVAVLAIGLAVFLWIRGPEEKIVIQQSEGDASKEELLARMTDLERTELELKAVRSYLAIVQDEEVPEARRDALEAWLENYRYLEIPEGTLADSESRSITQAIETEQAELAARLAARESRIEDAQRRSTEFLHAGDPASAILAAEALKADEEDDDETRELYRTVREQLTSTAMQRADEAFQTRVAELGRWIEEGNWARAIAACEKGAQAFPEPSQDLPAPALVDFQRYHEYFPEQREQCVARMESLRENLGRAELRSVVEAFSTPLREDLLSLSFPAALDRLATLLEGLSLPGYQDLSKPSLARLRAGQAALQKVFDGLADGSFPKEPPLLLDDGERATLTDYDAQTATFRVRISRGELGAASSSLPASWFAHPRGLSQLLLERYDWDAAARRDLIGLLVMIQAARWAEAVAGPLAERLERYDPETGWSADLAIEWPSDPAPSIATLVERLLEQGGDDSPEARALIAEARAEFQCHEDLRAALSPFLAKPPLTLAWSESLGRLRKMFKVHRDTILLRMVYATLHRGTEFPLADG